MDTIKQYKTVIVVRKDLEIPCGKLVAQAAHAVMRTNLTFLETIKNLPQYSYEASNKPPLCVVCYVKSETKLLNLFEKAKQANVPCALQIDAGYNFLPENTPTALCIGPDIETKINTLTKRLQVFNS